MNTSATAPAPAAQDLRLAADQSLLLQLAPGTELYCLRGAVQLRPLRPEPMIGVEERWLPPGHAWRADRDLWLALHASQASRLRLLLPATPPQKQPSRSLRGAVLRLGAKVLAGWPPLLSLLVRRAPRAAASRTP